MWHIINKVKLGRIDLVVRTLELNCFTYACPKVLLLWLDQWSGLFRRAQRQRANESTSVTPLVNQSVSQHSNTGVTNDDGLSADIATQYRFRKRVKVSTLRDKYKATHWMVDYAQKMVKSILRPTVSNSFRNSSPVSQQKTLWRRWDGFVIEKK